MHLKSNSTNSSILKVREYNVSDSLAQADNRVSHPQDPPVVLASNGIPVVQEDATLDEKKIVDRRRSHKRLDHISK